MREDFLHYIWKYGKIDFSTLKTVQGETVVIINPGQYLELAGPDFFNSQVIIGSQKWAGNIEIHIKSSDWYLHQHEKDDAYNSIILHVVWEYDVPIFRKDNTEIPVLELKKYTAQEIIEKYHTLSTPKTWIFCEKQIQSVDDFILSKWQERLFFERLEQKSKPITLLLQETNNDWEAVFFCMLTKNFGLNTNGDTFFKIAKSIPFSIIKKESIEVTYLEALLFGFANMFPIEFEDSYLQELISWFEYLKTKYKIEPIKMEPVQYFKHRPDNFPTIRLAQLAMLYHKQRGLFMQIMEANTIQEIEAIFNVSVSDYWQWHFTFDKKSIKKQKRLSKAFIHLLIINTIIPMKFAYAQSQGKEITETLVQLVSSIAPEKNTIIEKFNQFGIKATNAYQTQSLLQLKNAYCNPKKCLHCAIGLELIKK